MSGRARKCIVCGREFTPDKCHPYAKICGPTCRRAKENEDRRQRREMSRNPAAPTGVPGDDGSPENLTDAQLIEELQRRGYFAVKESVATDKRFLLEPSHFEGNTYRIGVVSDTHLGSRFQQLTHLRSFYKLLAHKEIDKVLHAGDLNEGTGNQYRGQKHEMFIYGYDRQRDYACEQYPREPGITTYVIDGSHDYSFYKTAGYNINQSIAEWRDDIVYLGTAGAYVDLPDIENAIYIHHPDGGVPYARSYRAQKTIENFSPQNKPHVYLAGHLHVMNILPMYRNVDGYQLGCFQSQTPYLKTKGLYPTISGMILELTVDESGLLSSRAEWYPFYVPVEEDY